MSHSISSLAAAAALALAVSTPALAQGAAPQLAVTRTADSLVRAGVTAFEREQYRQAAAFNAQALQRGLNSPRRAAAFNNLCASLAAAGDVAEARSACEASLEARETWQGRNNLGAVLWLSGEAAAAEVEFAAAAALAPNENIVLANLALTNSRTLASAE